MRRAALLTTLGLAVFGVGGYIAGRTARPRAVGQLRSGQQIEVPRDFCCCRKHAEGESNLSEALEGYAKAKSRGDIRHACLQASCVVDEYARAVKETHAPRADTAYLAHWEEIEQQECAAGGYLPPPHI